MEERTELRKSLTLYQLVLFGLAYMTPMIVFGTYGVLAETTNGFVPTSYLVALIAMLFTAYSYGRMVKAFPVAGSAYTYTRRSIGSHFGFMIGWTVLLDYFFLPMVIWLIGSSFLHAAFPGIPIWTWIIAFIALTTLINLIGIQITSNTTLLLMIFQLLVLGIFVALSIVNLLQGVGAGTIFSMNPFLSSELDFPLVIAGAAIACYSFLGFDAVTTLSEETIEAENTMPVAIFLITIIGGFLFIISSYFLDLVYPDFSKVPDTDTAAYEIALQIGGNLLGAVFLAGLVIAQFASGLSAQTSASRLLYAMGRDGVLPKKIFGFIAPTTRVPAFNLGMVGIIGLLAIAMDITTSTSFINFGAFITFTFVNITVIAHYFVKEKRRTAKGIILYLLLPLIGAGATIGLFLNLDKNAMILGSIWVSLGFIYLLFLTKFFTQKPPEMDLGFGRSEN